MVVLQDQEPVSWLLMPLIKVGTNTRVNGAHLASFLSPYTGAPVFLELVGIIERTRVRKQPLLHADHEHAGKFQSLCQMYRHHRDYAALVLHGIDVRDKGDLI